MNIAKAIVRNLPLVLLTPLLPLIALMWICQGLQAARSGQLAAAKPTAQGTCRSRNAAIGQWSLEDTVTLYA